MQNSERVALVLLAVTVFAFIGVPLSGGGMLTHAYGYDSSGLGMPELFGMALGIITLWAVIIDVAVLADRAVLASGTGRGE